MILQMRHIEQLEGDLLLRLVSVVYSQLKPIDRVQLTLFLQYLDHFLPMMQVILSVTVLLIVAENVLCVVLWN